MAKFRMRICPTPRASYNTIYDIYIVVVVVLLLLLLLLLLIAGPRRICDIYDFFVPHINVLTYLILHPFNGLFFQDNLGKPVPER